MADKTGLEETITSMLAVCLTNSVDHRALYLGQLVSSLSLYLEQKRHSQLDDSREAILMIFNAIANPDPEQKENGYARSLFKQWFVEHADIWYSDKYYDNVQLARHIEEIKVAEVYLDKGLEAYSLYKTNPKGVKDTLTNFNAVIKICQRVCGFYGLYEIDHEKMIQSFAYAMGGKE